MKDLNAKTPLDAAKKAKEIHDKANSIIQALIDIENYREQKLKEIKKHQSRGNLDALSKADIDFRVLNEKRLKAKENYKKYLVIVSKLLT